MTAHGAIARNWFLLTAAVLAVFNVARGLGTFGPHPVFVALGLTIVIALLVWRSPFTLEDLGLARATCATAHGSGWLRSAP